MKKLKLTDIAPYSGKRVHPFYGLKRYMSTGDLKGDNLSFEDVTYETKPSRADIIVSEGDILFAKMTNTNKALQIDKALDGIIVSTGFSVHRPIENILSGDYFLQFLKHQEFQRRKNKLCTGAIQSAISNSGIEKILVPVPDYDEQLHIAKLLSKAETLISQRKESIRLLDEFLKSTFLEMFGDPALNKKGWETLTIKELSLRFSDGPFGSNLKTEHYSVTGIQVIRLQNIGINEFIEKDISYVKSTHYESVLKKYSCYPGDVVIATMGDPNIRACIVPKHIDVAVNKADCVLFRVNRELSNPDYISHLLNLEGFLFLATSFIHGQTRARISSGQLAKISIPIPPIELQTQFAQIVENTEGLKSQCQKSLQELENLYGSLSQMSFRGELSIKQDGLMVAAEPEVTYSQIYSKIPEKSRGFAKQVLSGKIISMLREKDHFTHIKLQKLQYLAEHFIEEDLNWNYYRLTAGPYDNKYMHTLSARLKQNKWFEEKQFRFYPLGKVEEIDRYYEKYFGNKKEKLSKLFSLLINSTERLCEAVATIYAVWNNHIILKQEFNHERIKQDFFEWSNRKANLFSEADFEKALEWMQKHEIVPTGFGHLIKETKELR